MDVVAPERVYQVGMRTGAREEYRRKTPHLYPAHAVHPVEAVRSLLPSSAVIPSMSPSTWMSSIRRRLRALRPRACGLTASELIAIIRLLDPAIVGHRSHGSGPGLRCLGRTAIMASWILREAILTWWGAC